MRVADYLAEQVYKAGVKEVFLVSGGGMMFLSDGIVCHPRLKYICNHHEQACAMAAVGYAKYTGGLGVAYLTTGCGGTNAITGLLDAWQDSVPCVFISGQVKKKETVRNSGLALRQKGVQEADIISIVRPLTKYAEMVNDPQSVRYHFEKAVSLARSGRPGPVWLDIPMDVQAAEINPAQLKGFTPPAKEAAAVRATAADMKYLRSALNKAQRPVIVMGQGVRISGKMREFRAFIEKFSIPVVASRLGIDSLPSGHPLYIGRVGNKGDRAGNFAVQNSDLVISMGCRLSVSSTGHEYDKFARGARLVVVDIDPVEHSKNTVKIDRFIHADLKGFLPEISAEKGISRDRKAVFSPWAGKCGEWRKMWPVCLPGYAKERGGINMYHFVETLSRMLKKDSVVVSDAGSAVYVVSQGVRVNGEQRYITSGGQADMGFTLPAAIGVSSARGHGEVLGITGDGSFQMNIQELQTLAHYRLPVKLFVWNNDGYLSIRASQAKFFNERYIGTDSGSGVSFPSVKKIAGAYGIKYFKAASPSDLPSAISKTLAYSGPVLCEVLCQRDQEVVPCSASARLPDGRMVSRPLEDMYPFLDRAEFRKQMIVKPVED